MAALVKLKNFSGIAPRIAPRLLNMQMAQTADNCKLFSGELRPFKRPSIIATPTKAVNGTVQSIFRMNDGTTDFWLNWLTDVNCVRGPIAGDTAQRIYFTGDSEPRMSNLALAIGGADFPAAWFVLGVFAPKTKPTVAPSGGVGAATSRAYLYTFVTSLGEESAPSPPSTVTAGKVDDTWALSNMDAACPNTGTITGAVHASGLVTLTVNTTFGLRAGEQVVHAGVVGMTDLNGTFLIDSVVDTTHYKVKLTTAQTYTSGGTWTRLAPHNTAAMTKRIYRTLSATFKFVAEIAVATTTYNDTIADTALGVTIPSLDVPAGGAAFATWDMPPTDMFGLTMMPNGIMVGASKNNLCACEPYIPHAWPPGYQLSTPRNIVGIAAYSTTIVLGTKAEPYVVTGAHPSTFSMDKVDLEGNPCLSKRGTIGLPFGVVYPSPNGWVLVGVGGALVTSNAVLTKDEFTLFFPSTMYAVNYRDRYFVWYQTSPGVSRGLIFDKSGDGPSLVPLAQAADAAYLDPEQGELYIVHLGKIKKWDADPLNNLPFDWRSKTFVTPKPLNPGACRVDADYPALQDLDSLIAQIALDTAANALILAGSEAWPGQGVTKGCFDSMMVNEFQVNGSLLQGGNNPEFDIRTLQFQLYAMNQKTQVMELKFTKNLTNNVPFRLPAGYTATDFEIRFLGNVGVHSVELGESMVDLRQL